MAAGEQDVAEPSAAGRVEPTVLALLEPRAQAGLAAAMTSTGRQVGTSLGVAVFGTVAFAGLSGTIADGLAAAARPAWWIMAGCGVLVTALAVVSTGAWAAGTAERTRGRIEASSGTAWAG